LAFDFEKPVVDFINDDDGRIWVLLDREWDSNENFGNTSSPKMVKIVRLIEGEVSIRLYVRFVINT
jgi:hypothetical protein